MKTTNLFVTHFIYAIQLLLPTSTGELIQVKLNTENGQVLVWGALSKFRIINERCTDISSLKLPPRHAVRGSASSHGAAWKLLGWEKGLPGPGVSPHGSQRSSNTAMPAQTRHSKGAARDQS